MYPISRSELFRPSLNNIGSIIGNVMEKNLMHNKFVIYGKQTIGGKG